MRVTKWIAIAAASVLVAAGAAQAQVQHPAYVRALAELHQARAQLAEPPGAQPDINLQQAREQLGKAIQDIADTLDGNAPIAPSHTLMKASWDRQECLQRALKLLDQAHDDIELRQQDSYWKGLKANDAQDRVAAARQAIESALQQARH